MTEQIPPDFGFYEGTPPPFRKLHWGRRPVPRLSQDILVRVIRSVFHVYAVAINEGRRIAYPGHVGFYLSELPKYGFGLDDPPRELARKLNCLEVAGVFLPVGAADTESPDLFSDEYVPCLFPDNHCGEDLFVFFDRYEKTLKRLGRFPRPYFRRFNAEYTLLRDALIAAGVPPEGFETAELILKPTLPERYSQRLSNTEEDCLRILEFVHRWPLLVFSEIMQDYQRDHYESIRESLHEGIFGKRPHALEDMFIRVPAIDRPYWWAVLIRNLFQGVAEKVLKAPKTTPHGGRERHCDAVASALMCVEQCLTEEVLSRLVDNDDISPDAEAIIEETGIWLKGDFQPVALKYPLLLQLISALLESAGLPALPERELRCRSSKEAKMLYLTRTDFVRRNERYVAGN